MSLPNRIAAYDDCFTIFDGAIASGSRVCFATQNEAHHFMTRLHQARALTRDESKRLYDINDVRWGKTAWDALIVRHPREDEEGKWWIYIERAGSNIIVVESLGASPSDKPTNPNRIA